MAGTMLLHLLFTVVILAGSPYELPPPRDLDALEPMRIRLVEAPEPPPPSPPLGALPKRVGPRHVGRAAPAVTERSANVQAADASPQAAAPPTPQPAETQRPAAPEPKPVAAPEPPASLPQPAPAPQLAPVPLAGEPPAVSLAVPDVQTPVPPKFQPEAVRKPQEDGQQPVLTPPSLALPDLPTPSSPPVEAPSMALHTELPKTSAPASLVLARPEQAASPPVPEMQAVPLPAQAAPTVQLQSQVTPSSFAAPRVQQQIQAPSIEVAEAQLEAIPVEARPSTRVESHAPTVTRDMVDRSTVVDRPSIQRPELSAPPAAVASEASLAAAESTPSPADARQAAPGAALANAGDASRGEDVSRAPDASPTGSDSATPGQPDGVATARDAGDGERTPADATGKQGAAETSQIGKRGEVAQSGMDQGSEQGELGSYIQLKPTGDTEIMAHGRSRIGYKATRFEQDWTPQDESSVDTALRRAVEKTTVKSTIRLPRGVRVECAVTPLLPMALFSCGSADPPPTPPDPELYERMRLAPANASVPPVPSSVALAPAPMIKVDNRAECAAARVAGGPMPPGCGVIELPVKPAGPASSSSSWVPASDQFH